MKKLLSLLLVAGTLGAPACSSKKNDPAVDPNSLVPPNTVMVTVSGNPAVALTDLRVVDAKFGGTYSTLWLRGTTARGRILEVKFYGLGEKGTTPTTAPIGEISLIDVPAPVPIQVGTSLQGSVSNDLATNLAHGSFEATFPDKTTIKGVFHDLKTK